LLLPRAALDARCALRRGKSAAARRADGFAAPFARLFRLTLMRAMFRALRRRLLPLPTHYLPFSLLDFLLAMRLLIRDFIFLFLFFFS